MSAVEVIVAALAAGAGAGMKDTASVAVHDAYNGLKDMLQQRLGSGTESVRALDADETEPDVWRARLGTALADSAIASDEQVLAAAQRLLALADPETAKTFRIDVTNNYGAIGDFSAPVTFQQGSPVPPAPSAAT